MNKLKKILIIFTSILIILYLLFMILVYAFGNLNSYIPQLQNTVKDMTGLDFKVKSARITPTPKVEVKLAVDNLELTYPNSKKIASIDNATIKVPILPIIFGDIKLSEIKVEKPQANFVLSKNGEIDLIKYLEPYLEKMQTEQNPEEKSNEIGLPKYFRISTKMPDVKITNYNINIFDEGINQEVSLKGDTLDLVKFDLSKGLKLITKGQLSTEKQIFSKYDLSVETFFPKAEEKKEQNSVEMAYIDPFKSMVKYNFYSDISADLKITESKNDGVNIKGIFDLKELNLKSGNTDTKGTYAKLKFNQNKIDVDSNLYLTKNQKAQINANLEYGKKTDIDLKVKSDKLDLVHFINIAQALFNTFGMDNELNSLNVSGYISPNFEVKSDMKTLLSSGHIYLKDGKISHKSFPANISDIQSDIDLANNKITIKDTKALVNGQPVNVQGTITQDANCDLKINSQNLSLPSLFEIFADKTMKNTYNISSGILDFDVKIKGKLDKIMPEATAKISSLNLTDKINHYSVSSPKLDLKITTDLKTYKGNLTFDTTKLYLSDLKLTTLIKNLKLNFDEKDLTINPFDIDIQNSIFKTQGTVSNYMSDMKFDISTSGNMSTTTLKTFIPKEFKSMISNSGSLPINANISGNMSEIGITAQVSANSTNYITPIHITQLKGKPTTLKADIKTKGNDLIINNITLDSGNTHFANVKGQILSYAGKNPIFKNLKINTPNSFSFSIPDMPNSLVTLTSDLTIGGTMNAPAIIGNINISQLNVPSFKLKGNNIAVNMTNSAIKASSNDIKIDNSDIQFNMNANNNFGKVFTINNLTVNSNNFDLGKVLEVLASMPQNSNAPGTDFPLLIKSGHGNIKNFKLDAIAAQNSSADFDMSDNTLNLKNLKATAYKGNIEGDLSYNLQYLRMKTKMKGQNLDANSAVTAFVGLKDQMNGNLNFNADITMSGAEYKQQMQTLKGTASFVILDGQMGSLGKFEHFLYAQNLLSQSFVKTTIGSIASNLAPKNTGKFTKMSGDIGFSNGWAKIVQVTSTGPNMSLYLTGKFNLLNNNANIDILGNISKDVANSLGIVSDLSLEKLTSNITSKLGTTISKVSAGYNLTTSKEVMKKIPQLSTGATEGTKSFKVKIDGNIESTSSVKSFMWLMNEAEAKAKQTELIQNSKILESMPNLKEKLLNKNSDGDSTTQPAASTTTTKENSSSVKQTETPVKEEPKTNTTESPKTETNNQTLPSFLNDIGTEKSE